MKVYCLFPQESVGVFFMVGVSVSSYLQCLDTVGWVTGRKSGL